MAKIVIEEMGLKKVELKYTGGKRGWPGDVPYVFFDVSKLSKLGWCATHSSTEVIRIATAQLLSDISKTQDTELSLVQHKKDKANE